MNVFFSFIGGNDRSSIMGKSLNLGPVGTILVSKGCLFDETILFLDPSMRFRKDKDTNCVTDCLNKIAPYYKDYFLKKLTVILLPEITNPANHQQIYDCLSLEFAKIVESNVGEKPRFYFNLSSGTSSMHAILMLFGKARYEAVMFQTYEKDGKELVEKVTIPFPITLATVSQGIRDEAGKVRKVIQQEAEGYAIIGNHPSILDAKARTTQYALCGYNMLITGESGTGKELFARHYQKNNPDRNKAAFVCENCANFPENLIEAELFGYAKGAFTGANKDKKGSFERADKGVLFLDEIGEMPQFLQARLLRVMETGEIRPVGSEKTIKVDVRIVAATNSPEKLRSDLRYRLAVGIIDLPPLRDRGDDILTIAESILFSTNKDLATRLRGEAPYYYQSFDESAKELLLTNTWRGNVRELISVVKRACALESEPNLSAAMLQKHMLGYVNIDKPRLSLPFNPDSEIIINQPVNLKDQLKEIKKAVLHSKITAFKSKRQMAEFFGLNSDSALNVHLKDLSFSKNNPRKPGESKKNNSM